MAERTGSGEVHNALHGGSSGSVVQAGVVHGGVHFHHAGAVPERTVPRQLLAPPANFVGRGAELDELDRAWAERGGQRGLALVTGAAGIGKSALASHWAELVTPQFPDGQLYANLGAFDPGGPAAPGEVLGYFLRALGMAPDRVPVGVPEQASAFRSLTADRRLLVVLDNAISAAQVRQLLPSAAGCMVVVTTRWRLAGLVGEGARIVALDPLDEPAAVELLSRTVGPVRTDAEPAAASALAALCAGLPIALSVAGARLAAHPRWSIGKVVTELSDEHRRLAGLSIPQDASVRAAFDLSYRSLSAPVARCYRAVGIHPGPRLGPAVIAAGLAVPREEATALLDALVEASLLGDISDDRYHMHDLVRLHARQYADGDPERDVLARRMAEWYLAGTHAADLLLTPYRRRQPDNAAYLGGAAVCHAGRDEALDWLERERVNLVATVRDGAAAMPELAWRLADGMWALFHYRRHHADRMTVDRVAVQCARRLGNRGYEARMVKRWAFAHFDADQMDEAKRLFAASLELCRELDDRYGVAAAIGGLGTIALAQRRYRVAIDHFAEELAICRSLGERRRAGLALLNLGRVATATGHFRQAVEHLTAAREAFAELGDLDSYNAARTRIELGRALAGVGRHDGGTAELSGALADMVRLGSPRGQAQAHHALGELALAGGATADAHTHLTEAHRLYHGLGDAEADEVLRLAGTVPPAQADPHRMPEP
jgi:tetratricopeptide (TPR) repeat protein